MSEYKININYAKALYQLAAETDQMEPVLADMRLVNNVCAENHELVVVFNNPVIKEAKKIAILEDLFGEKATRLTMLFLNFVVKKRRTINLKGISAAFIDLYRQNHGIIYSELVTAVEVDDESISDVKQLIADYTKHEVELNARVDNKMLGGFCMTFDNNMYDARLRTKLRKMRQAFDENIYEKKL